MFKRRALDQLYKVPTILGADEFVGDLKGRDNYIVRGRVTGNSDIEGALMLGPQAHWKGNLTADVVVVKGKVEGRVTGRLKVELRNTAAVQGDIVSPIIAVAEGAKVQGRVPKGSHVTRFSERRER